MTASKDQNPSDDSAKGVFKAGEDATFDAAHPVFAKAKVKFSADADDADILGEVVDIPTYDYLFTLLNLPESEKESLPEMSPVYPCKAVLFKAKELRVPEGRTIIMGRQDFPTLVDMDSITIEAGGQLLVTWNTAIKCGSFTQL